MWNTHPNTLDALKRSVDLEGSINFLLPPLEPSMVANSDMVLNVNGMSLFGIW